MKVVGRLAGWVLVAVAMIMASAEAVMALSPADHPGIATRDVVMLITGGTPKVTGLALLLQLPAWIVFGLMGSGLLVACRKRPRRWIFFRR